jgi:plastocyanin
MSHPTLKHDRQGADYGEEQDVQNLHAAIESEEHDGRITIKPFSLWVLVILGLAFFFAGFFSARNGPHFSAASVDSGNPPLLESTLPAVEPGAHSASAVQAAVADANTPAVVHVAMKNMKFDPAIIEVKSGDTVEWTNEDITPHTATATKFDSASIASDKSWRHTFTEAGDFPYACTFHPDMKGVVIVK